MSPRPRIIRARDVYREFRRYSPRRWHCARAAWTVSALPKRRASTAERVLIGIATWFGALFAFLLIGRLAAINF